MTNPFLDAALKYIDMGFKVVILGKQSKETITRWTPNGFLDGTYDPDVARGWWELTPKCNVAIVCGETAEQGRYLTVLDFDVDSDNDVDSVHDFLIPWEKEHGELPETVTEITGRGGMHYFYFTKKPIPKCENQKIHVDIRGVGSYTMVSPSIHPNGNEVAWENHPDDYEIAWADDNVYELIDLILEGAVDEGNSKGSKVDMSSGLVKGSRNTDLYSMASGFMSQSWDDEAIVFTINAFNKQSDDPLPQSEVDKVISSALKLPKGKSAEWYESHGIKKESEEFKASAEVRSMLSKKANGVPMNTITNCMTVLGNDRNLKGHFCYNEMAYANTVECPVPWDSSKGTRKVTDLDYSQFAAYLERVYGITEIKTKGIDAISNVCSFNRYHPVREWLDSLEWDGVPRVDTLLIEFMKADANEYSAEAIKLFMRGAIARTLEPGCKFDTMLVLVGDQGIGKSTFIRMLSHNATWYNGNFNTIEGDTAIEKLQGKWILEMGELLALKKAKEIEAVKSFITNQIDVIRPKFGRTTMDRPRVCVFAGTTNDIDFLSDPTGNRRFLPVKSNLKKGEQILLFAEGVQEHFDQCWAEVYHYWKEGEQSLVLPEHLIEYAENMRSTHVEDDPRIGMIQEYLDGVMQNSMNPESVRICVLEILKNALDYDDYRNAPHWMINDIHSIMRNSIEGFLPYPRAGGKAQTPDFGIQRCYVIDVNHPRFAALRQI